MKAKLQKLAIIASEKDSIDIVFRRMAEHSKKVIHAGLAIILDKKNRLKGVLTDGDLRRAYSRNVPFCRPVEEIMEKNPIVIPATTATDQIALEVLKLLRQSQKRGVYWIRHIPLVGKKMELIDVLDSFLLIQNHVKSGKNVAVLGMGYVGLSVGVSLANRGHLVTGVDIRKDLLTSLSKGRSTLLEPGLQDMLQVALSQKHIRFDFSIQDNSHDVYIVAVGTPISRSCIPQLHFLKKAVDSIGHFLKRGDLVVLRSTVPVGTTRTKVVPWLEEKSGLTAGKHFHVAFAPERTAEGSAIHELRMLPQVVGGLSAACTRMAAQFWSTLTPFVIQASSLEASELVKLANNTFRDLSFAFANEVALIAEHHNDDAFDLIRAANEGYPRNPIPLPSPGVGGYCLSKDPYIFGFRSHNQKYKPTLGRTSRIVNNKAMLYAYKVLQKYSLRIKKSIKKMKILLVGIAFKGIPETNDLRGSVALKLAQKLTSKKNKIWAWDAVVSSQDLKKNGLQPQNDLNQAILKADAVLILNNHPKNIESSSWIKPARRRLVFDGWHQLDAAEMEKINKVTYATMGYMTPEN